jgi:hypothetical protein
LVADIPDQPIARGLEDVMEYDRQLDDTQPCPKMAAGDRYSIDRFLAKFIRELLELLGRKVRHIRRNPDGVE